MSKQTRMPARGKKNGYRRNTRGESMVVAVVLMLVFFILGLAVLTGASVASAGVNARVRYRQAYYYARSVLDVLDESLQNGELGEYIREYERVQLSLRPGTTLFESREISIPVSFSGTVIPEGLTIADGGAKLRYDVASERLSVNYVSVALENVELTVGVEYGGRIYHVSAAYSYTGFVEYRLFTGRVWDDQWRVRGMS